MVSVIFMIVFLLVAVMIVGLVLLQEGKGGGLTGMSAGMDGVMGAKNPLRRLTAYLFVFFVLMCIGINWYFHESSTGEVVPQGLELPAPPAGPTVVNSPEAAIEAITNALETGEVAPSAPEAAPAAPAVETPAPEAAPVAETPVAAPATPAPEAPVQ